MIADREVKKEIKGQTRFVVTREFGGTQTMQQAFEQLIEKKTEEHIFFSLYRKINLHKNSIEDNHSPMPNITLYP